MLAAIYKQAGNPDALLTAEVPRPEPGPSEVCVRVTVSGVNPTDWKAVRDNGPDDFAVPNQDGAGVIDSVGPHVDNSRIGQRVWVMLAAYQRRWGTAAQYCVVPAQYAVPLPEGASDELGASLGVPAVTAWHALTVGGPVDGRSVLVAGGAGAVGHAAIELAKWQGAYVVATVSGQEKARLASASGADLVVNYRDPDAARQIRMARPGIDRFVEVALSANLSLDISIAAPHSEIVVYADEGGAIAHIPPREMMTRNITLRYMLLYGLTPNQLTEAVEHVNLAVAESVLTVQPLHRFPLAEAAAAHQAVKDGAVGKVIIDVDQR